MIKFFRQIRKSLLMENRTSKYFKYALGEILLVVIGILIALQINNWNETRKERIKEVEILNLLKLDLENTLAEVTEDIKNGTSYLNITDSIMYYNPEKDKKPFEDYFLSNPDEIWFLDDVMLYPSKATYENLKSTGIELIKDTNLRYKIIELYERLLPRVAVWENLVIEYEKRLLVLVEQDFKKIPIKNEYNKHVLAPKSYEAFIKNDEINNALVTYQERRRASISRYGDVKLLVEDILKSINKKLEQ